MSPNETANAWTSRLPSWLPYAVFAVLFAVTFKRWILPFQDSGRELAVASRVAAGEALYRDIGYPYGPLAPFLDGPALLLFGRRLDVLIALRTAVALLGVEALRRLARRVTPDDGTAVAIVAFVIATCGFVTGGAYPFPYSAAALEGTVGTWWALELALASTGMRTALTAGLVAGIASAAKLEIAPAALGAVAVALFLRRPKREAAAGLLLGAVIAGAAFGIPVALYGTGVLRRHGYLIALDMPKAFRELYERSVLFGGMTSKEFRGGGWTAILFPSILYLALALLVLSAKVLHPVATGAMAIAAGLATAFSSSRNAELHVLLPLAAAIGVYEIARALWTWRRGAEESVARAGLAVAMMPALARQPFFLRNLIYGAYSAPLALLMSLAWVARRVAARGAFVGLLLGMTIGQGVHRWRDIGRASAVWTVLPGASLYLPAEEAKFLQDVTSVLPRLRGTGGFVATFPEPGFVNFVTGTKNPFVDEAFYPGLQDERAEEEMIQILRERRPALIVTNTAFREYGPETFGHGLLDRFFEEVRTTYVIAGKLGGLPLGPHGERHVSEGLLYLPRR